MNILNRDSVQGILNNTDLLENTLVEYFVDDPQIIQVIGDLTKQIRSDLAFLCQANKLLE